MNAPNEKIANELNLTEYTFVQICEFNIKKQKHHIEEKLFRQDKNLSLALMRRKRQEIYIVNTMYKIWIEKTTQ